MLSILLKIKAKVLCQINEKEYIFENGVVAYQELKGKYVIKVVNARDSMVILELELLEEGSNWEEEYENQFGVKPSYF